MQRALQFISWYLVKDGVVGNSINGLHGTDGWMDGWFICLPTYLRAPTLLELSESE